MGEHCDYLRGFKQVDPADLQMNAIKAIGDAMEVVLYNGRQNPNAMTASWGGLGVMWNMPVAFVVIRGEQYRFSRHLMDEHQLFSLCFLEDGHQDALAYLGTAHGWDDPQKIVTAGLTEGWFCGAETAHDPNAEPGTHQHVPFIEESKTVLICEKVCKQELPRETFVDPAVWERCYGTEGPHCLYIAEIRAAFVRE